MGEEDFGAWLGGVPTISADAGRSRTLEAPTVSLPFVAGLADSFLVAIQRADLVQDPAEVRGDCRGRCLLLNELGLTQDGFFRIQWLRQVDGGAARGGLLRVSYARTGIPAGAVALDSRGRVAAIVRWLEPSAHFGTDEFFYPEIYDTDWKQIARWEARLHPGVATSAHLSIRQAVAARSLELRERSRPEAPSILVCGRFEDPLSWGDAFPFRTGPHAAEDGRGSLWGWFENPRGRFDLGLSGFSRIPSLPDVQTSTSDDTEVLRALLRDAPGASIVPVGFNECLESYGEILRIREASRSRVALLTRPLSWATNCGSWTTVGPGSDTAGPWLWISPFEGTGIAECGEGPRQVLVSNESARDEFPSEPRFAAARLAALAFLADDGKLSLDELARRVRMNLR